MVSDQRLISSLTTVPGVDTSRRHLRSLLTSPRTNRHPTNPCPHPKEASAMPALLSYLITEIRHRWKTMRDTKDGGYSTEAVLVTALLVGLAIVVIGIIALKVTGKANSINL